MADPVSERIQKLIDEGLLGMAEAARAFGTYRNKRPTHPSTLTRWCLDGIRLADGRRLRLEFIRVGDRLMTSRPALMRFLAAQQDPSSILTASAPRTPSQRHKANTQAEAVLEALGVK